MGYLDPWPWTCKLQCLSRRLAIDPEIPFAHIRPEQIIPPKSNSLERRSERIEALRRGGQVLACCQAPGDGAACLSKSRLAWGPCFARLPSPLLFDGCRSPFKLTCLYARMHVHRCLLTCTGTRIHTCRQTCAHTHTHIAHTHIHIHMFVNYNSICI